LEISKSEALILFKLTQDQQTVVGQGSVLYQLLTVPLIRLFGTGNLIVRFWPAAAGAALVLMPLFFEDVLGKEVMVLLAFMIALDPFVNANSIQINGSALTLCTLLLAWGWLRNQKYLPALLAIFGFLLSGAAIIYALIFGIFILLVDSLEKKAGRLLEQLAEIWDYCRQNVQVIAIIAAVLVLVIFLLGIRISDFIGNFQFFFRNWGQPYSVGQTPQLYPIALFSYFPLIVLLLLFGNKKVGREFPSLVTGLGGLLLLVFISMNPGHQILDLVWVSLPIALLGAVNLEGLIIDFGENPARIKTYTLIFACLLTSFCMTAVMVIYQFNWGLSAISVLLSMISLLIILIMSFIFLAYSESIPLALATTRSAFIIVFFIIQIAFTWRSLGFNGYPSSEILWGGYFDGADVVQQIVDNSGFNVVKTRMNNKVAFCDYDNKSVEWNVGRRFPNLDLPLGMGETNYTVLITAESDALTDKTNVGYLGQKFVADSYPLWVWQPMKSLLDSDYWFWLIFREGQMYKEFNYIWVNQNVF
jgi:hypothetical protein